MHPGRIETLADALHAGIVCKSTFDDILGKVSYIERPDTDRGPRAVWILHIDERVIEQLRLQRNDPANDTCKPISPSRRIKVIQTNGSHTPSEEDTCQTAYAKDICDQSGLVIWRPLDSRH